MANVAVIALPLQHQLQILVTEEITSPSERRRIQNRENQRKMRRRKALMKKASLLDSVDKVSPSRKSSTGSEDLEIVGKEPALHQLFRSAASSSILARSELGSAANLCHLSEREAQQAIAEFERWVMTSAKGEPRVDHLLVLVKFNVFRALVANSDVLGFSTQDGMDDDALSPFGSPLDAENVLRRHHINKLPVALQPTRLQQEIPHHPWIDLLPVPEMRDSLLRAGDSFDDMELCGDLVGFFSSSTGRTGMVIWGEPWDIAGWEVTEDFLKHWGWAIRGCQSIIQSTNYWRAKRGEKPLRFNPM
ncbi:hypothetical protein BGZ60DRAFT_41550 [Tricladium varicosporioides]|nr:hypothetical protein BGZ60DRAFT_41550 [Hymenoscyphus varicosporioides]